MKVLVFNGAGESVTDGKGTAANLNREFISILQSKGLEPLICNVSESGVPLFHTSLFSNPPQPVRDMADAFVQSDIQIWLTPMYHGSMPGIMKNSLDWLEVTHFGDKPYLTDKIVALVCWADGGQAMLGIDALDNVAKSLRAWVLPYSVPIVKGDLYDAETGAFSVEYNRKMNKMVDMLIASARLFSAKKSFDIVE